MGSLKRQQGCSTEMLQEDSYRWLLKLPKHWFGGRGLVYIDPPYDSYESYTAWNLFILKHLASQWPAASVALWYPLRDAEERASFLQRLRALQLGEILVVEMSSAAAETSLLAGSGIALLNSPNSLRAALERVLPALAEALSCESPSMHRVSIFTISVFDKNKLQTGILVL